MNRTPIILLTAATLAACAADRETPPSEVDIRIVDGVAIVENPGLHLADTQAWRIDTTNAVRIGVVDGPEEYMFGQIAGVLGRPDGSILVADGLARELRLYDADGSFIRSAGGEGEGPGEFRGITDLAPYRGDSIAVFTGQQVTILGPKFEFGRRFRARLQDTRAVPPMTSDQLMGIFADGRLLMSDYLDACDVSGGVCADSVAFFRTDEEGATTARFEGEFVYERRERHSVRPGLFTGWNEPHPQAFWTTRGNRFYYADAIRFEIRVYNSGGELERVMRVAGEAPRYARDEVFADPDADPDADPRTREALRVLREARANTELPDTFPFFSDLLVDAADNVWVREYLPPAVMDGAAPRWYVFDPEGRLRHAVRSPPGMIRSVRPYTRLKPWIGEEYVLGIERDEFDIERVAIYPLIKDARHR